MIRQHECHCGNKQSDPLTADGFCEACDESYKRPTRWIVVVNTMGRITGTDTIGWAISSHRSLHTAERARLKAKRGLTGGAYVPTMIVTLLRRYKRGEYVNRRDLALEAHHSHI